MTQHDMILGGPLAAEEAAEVKEVRLTPVSFREIARGGDLVKFPCSITQELTVPFHSSTSTFTGSRRTNTLNELGFVVAIPNESQLAITSEAPAGPHPVWAPIEHFGQVYSWLMLNRPENLSILIHPLTKEKRKDRMTGHPVSGVRRVPRG
ncbi:hypothetical protein BDK51DRAFT_26703 [Blyttiomyces helicus]|uniref:Uncharacterized protein n=1 Tax=Blyttiomyces helicus TaxID=388810 RepID=A0A4P9W864_9FUNG|nr:hypothetical protein BDK51DRAFT_26703 [Blyttiomyces helicus]|eukprot:RKO87258.1 hypothetical protein BDK51DRAFT_26703 [Blyttiomyces helicus]